MLSPPFYVISDTHFYHDNIVKYCSRDLQIKMTAGKPIDHNVYMVDQWNSVVGPDDPILHLGDVFAWFKDGQTKFEHNVLPRLNGRKYLIMGNHDKAPASEFERMGFTVLDPFTIQYKGKTVSFSHYPQEPGTQLPEGRVHIHGHIHNNGYPKTKNWREGSNPTERNQVNVSVEVVDYTPQTLDSLVP